MVTTTLVARHAVADVGYYAASTVSYYAAGCYVATKWLLPTYHGLLPTYHGPGGHLPAAVQT